MLNPSILQQDVETEVAEGSGTPRLRHEAGTRAESKELEEREPSPKRSFGGEG